MGKNLEKTDKFNIFDVLKISGTEIRHSNQLNRYRKIWEDEYAGYQRIYIYLTPDGEEPGEAFTRRGTVD